MDEQDYKKLAEKFPILKLDHTEVQPQNLAFDAERGDTYIFAQNEADYQKFLDKIRRELVARGVGEEEAIRCTSNIKCLRLGKSSLQSQQPPLELRLIDESGSIPNPTSPEQREQVREAFCRLYSQAHGVDIATARIYLKTLRDILNEQSESYNLN